jgi:pyruvate kinase
VCRRLALWWGVTPVHQALAPDLEGTIGGMERYLLQSGAANSGETVVIAGSHPLQEGVHTNFVKFHQLG